MTLKEAKSVYFVGIGGIGMSAVARLCLAVGKKVSGSDMRDSATTSSLRTMGATIYIGHDETQLKNRPDVVVYSEDITEESPGFIELKEAKTLGIHTTSYSKALGELMEEKYGIGVTGTNGKSTTTAILGLILENAGLDPTVVVGSKLSEKNQSDKFRENARLGNGQHLVAEADEYHRHMLDGHPKMIVLTNIAEDHLDYYKDLNEIKSAFADYVKSLPAGGILIFNADDHNAVEIGRSVSCHKYTFGIHHYADLQAMNIAVESGRQSFDLHLNDQTIGKFNIKIPGQFNISNAIGAALAAIKLGVDVETIRKTLENFAGIWRRFEVVGGVSGRPIISDYAHHPAGVTATIQAAKEFYPGKKILVVFQPHHRNRTKKLFGGFVESLLKADEVILPEIFDVAGREHGENISSQDLMNELVKLNVPAQFVPNLEAAAELIKTRSRNFDVILCMGAGEIDGMARRLVEDSNYGIKHDEQQVR